MFPYGVNLFVLKDKDRSETSNIQINFKRILVNLLVGNKNI